jgi:hypothetical protein
MAAVVKITQIWKTFIQLLFIGINMTAVNSLTRVISIHTTVEYSSKHIRTNMSILCRKTYRAHAHFQLHTFRSDIIWIMSNEIILLLFNFNLIPTGWGEEQTGISYPNWDIYIYPNWN